MKKGISPSTQTSACHRREDIRFADLGIRETPEKRGTAQGAGRLPLMNCFVGNYLP